MFNHSAGVGFSNAGLDFFQVPLLRFQISLDRLIEKIGAIPLHRTGERVQCSYFVGRKAKTNCLLFHKCI